MTTDDSPIVPPELPDAAVEAALRGHRSGGEHAGLERVADAMNALRRPGDGAEWAGHGVAMAAYQEHFAGRASGPRRVVLVSSVARARLLATAAGSAVALGAVATVLFATSLGPGTGPQTLPVGSGATTTKAAAPSTSGTAAADDEGRDDEGRGPDAKGPAAFGLCNAWSNHQAKGKAQEKVQNSTAFRNLAKAAGGEANIARYCATVPHPGQGRGHDKDKGKPTRTKTVEPGKTAKPEATAKPDATARPSTTAKPETTAKPTKSAVPSRTSTTTRSTTTSTTSTTA